MTQIAYCNILQNKHTAKTHASNEKTKKRWINGERIVWNRPHKVEPQEHCKFYVSDIVVDYILLKYFFPSFFVCFYSMQVSVSEYVCVCVVCVLETWRQLLSWYLSIRLITRRNRSLMTPCPFRTLSHICCYFCKAHTLNFCVYLRYRLFFIKGYCSFSSLSFSYYY